MPADAPRRLLVLADLGDALLWSGRFDEADSALSEAIELADRAGDERTRVTGATLAAPAPLPGRPCGGLRGAGG